MRAASKTKRAIIFDLDGVLVDSEPLESKALEKLLLSYGKKPKYNDVGLIHKPGTAGDVYMDIINDYQLNEELEILRTKKRKIFKQLVKKELTAIEGALKLVGKLKKEGYKVGIASNRFVDLISTMLDKIRARLLFNVIVGAKEGMNFKPHPDIYLLAAKQLNAKPTICIAIEDSEIGVASAKAAGMKVIAIPSIYTNPQDFSKADKIVKSFSEISLKLLEQL